ncbi:glycosyltransferase family 25 protein [Rhodosalinus sp. K401]|uniref:glycosyltransferase family 25 protein n=1 Tax=Rhodosalinus sp. K401 TaxID=3239195 RepID=UPI0035258466
MPDAVEQGLEEGNASMVWPIVVLSLPGEEVRRRGLLTALARFALDYEVFIGVDGRNGLPACWERDIDRSAARFNIGRDLTDGEFACALSHREIYRKIERKGWQGAVVLEDDAIIDRRFADFVRGELFRRADLIMLDHSRAYVRGKGLDIMKGVTMRRLALPSYLTTGYSISAAGARSLLASSRPVSATADWPGDIVSLGAMALEPRIVDHPDKFTGTSHLRDARVKIVSDHGGKRGSAKRRRATTYWKRWLIKRLSSKIS